MASFFFVLASMQAQQGMVNNKGILTVKPQSQVGVRGTFTNHTTGDVINDGEIHFFNDFTNNGLFSYTTNTTTGYVVFSGITGAVQNIQGNSPSFFYDVLYHKASNDPAFHLSNETTYAGTVNLFDGVVWVDQTAGGAFIFLKGANHINTSDNSHVQGTVTKEGNDAFVYPIGDVGFYRMASITAPATQAHSYTGEYVFSNSNDFYPHESRAGVLSAIDENEFWIINQAQPNDESVAVTLSWDARTTPAPFIEGDTSLLRVARWDEEQELWVDEGGIVDTASKTVTTLTKVEGFGVFTLAQVKKNLLNPGDLVIYNGVTPNNDGMNDYFLIDNIQMYPRNTVQIFNRYGHPVFYTESYDSTGNVFTGVAEGKGIVNKGEKLPSGTYYYILEYYITENGADRLVKRVGYLHLETP